MSSDQLLLQREPESVCSRCCNFLSGSRETPASGGRASVELQPKAVEDSAVASPPVMEASSSTSSLVTTATSKSEAVQPTPSNAKQAIESLQRAATAFEALAGDLPKGAEEALKGLRSRIEELEEFVQQATRWEKKCPSGGTLNWMQVAPAAGFEEPPEWALGKLFVAKDCLLFEADEQPSWSIGPVMWQDVKRVELLQGDAGENMRGRPMDIRMHYGSAGMILRLQLRLVDMAWLERALPSGTSVVAVSAEEEAAKQAGALKAEEAAAEVTPVASPGSRSQRLGSFKPPSFFGKQTQNELSFFRGATNVVSASFYKVAKDMSSATALRLKDAAYSVNLIMPSLDDIFEKVSSQKKNMWIDQFIKDNLKGGDVQSTPWADSRRQQGTYMSQTKWNMPVPESASSSLAGLIDLPESLALTLVSRLCYSDQEMILTQRGYCQNVQYGENFLLNVTFTFRPQDDGNVLFDAFVDVNWVVAMPASHSILKDIIETLSRQHVVSFSKALAALLGGGDEVSTVSFRPTYVFRTGKTLDLATLAEEEPEEVPLRLEETLHLTGLFTKWSTEFEGGRLTVVEGAKPGRQRLKLCIRLTSESLSFAVVSGSRGWKWRLFPRDAVPISICFIKSHVSKEGVLTKGDADAVPTALGDLSVGHGLNYHVLEKEGMVVTVWVEVPVKEVNGTRELRTDTAEGARVWYTREDTGIHHVGGDGMDLSKYRKWLPPRPVD